MSSVLVPFPQVEGEGGAFTFSWSRDAFYAEIDVSEGRLEWFFSDRRSEFYDGGTEETLPEFVRLLGKAILKEPYHGTS